MNENDLNHCVQMYIYMNLNLRQFMEDIGREIDWKLHVRHVMFTIILIMRKEIVSFQFNSVLFNSVLKLYTIFTQVVS